MVRELHKLVQESIRKESETKTAAFQQTITIGGFNNTNFNVNQVKFISPGGGASGALTIAQGVG
jgi:hypothetical protein